MKLQKHKQMDRKQQRRHSWTQHHYFHVIWNFLHACDFLPTLACTANEETMFCCWKEVKPLDKAPQPTGSRTRYLCMVCGIHLNTTTAQLCLEAAVGESEGDPAWVWLIVSLTTLSGGGAAVERGAFMLMVFLRVHIWSTLLSRAGRYSRRCLCVLISCRMSPQ